MPAYNAEQTLKATYDDVMEQGVVDLVIVVDDASLDGTAEVASKLANTRVIVHDRNKGYGANQKSCYQAALAEGADIVIMVHPDYQYTPRLIPAMACLIGNGLFGCALGSRILGGRDRALGQGMPLWKYASNRFLTAVENVMLGTKLSEYHTGYRAFSRTLLETIPIDRNSDDFVFDNQMLAQIVWAGFPIGEISCPTKYFKEASSINFFRSLKYGFACLATGMRFALAHCGLLRSPLFPPDIKA